MHDQQIVELFWRRDPAAIEQIRERYGNYCFAIAHRILGSDEDAEEAVSDAMFAAWNAMPPHRPETLSAFVGKLTRCAALKKWRDARVGKRGGGEVPLALEELGECVSCGPDPAKALEGRELAELIDVFLQSLRPAERRAFVLRYWYLEPIREIGAQLGASESKVKSMLFRLRKRLASRLQDYEEGSL